LGERRASLGLGYWWSRGEKSFFKTCHTGVGFGILIEFVNVWSRFPGVSSWVQSGAHLHDEIRRQHGEVSQAHLEPLPHLPCASTAEVWLVGAKEKRVLLGGLARSMAKPRRASHRTRASTGSRRAIRESMLRRQCVQRGRWCGARTLGRNAEAIRNSPEQLSTCLALIEIVNLVQSRVSDVLRRFADGKTRTWFRSRICSSAFRA
jgi:hypothetical protein